jgi:peptidoglycan/LPS O-acetylase OafA/YrhL
VVAVVLYHFGVPGIQGGFVGVDVFFVISGFLMTGLIINGLDRPGAESSESFSLLSFYLARARRIVPALAVLCATLLALGWFHLSFLGYGQMGKHVIAALAFMSNFQFSREAGYFDVASHEKWLLHTWSLSVEWQFYLILPLILMGLWRLWPGRPVMTGWLLVGFWASLALSVVLTPLKPAVAFYLLHTRAWEMLAGGLVFMLADRQTLGTRVCHIMELAGFALILYAIAFTDPGLQWPGWRALVPVVGAMLVLAAARSDSLWTGSRAAQSLGNASYSIYLWHWPVVVGLAYADLLSNPWAIVTGLLASLLLGQASYRCVEQPTRKRLAAWPWRPNVAVLAGVAGLVAVAAVMVHLKNGVAGRIDPHTDAIFAEAKNVNPRMVECHKMPPAEVPECIYGGQSLGIIVIGDSHAASVVGGIGGLLKIHQHVLDWTYNACPTLEGVRSTDPIRGGYCGEFVRQAIERSGRLKDAPLIIVNRASVYIHGPNDLGSEKDFGKISISFGKTYETLEPEFISQWRNAFVGTACKFAQTRPVYMVRPIPEMPRDVPRTMGRAALFGRHERVSISLDEYHQRHRLVWEAQDAARAECGVHILDPLPYLCSDGRCWGDKDGMPIYFDDDHLNERGAALLQPLFETMLKQQVNSSPATLAARP